MKQKPILTSVVAFVLAVAAIGVQAEDKEAKLLGEPIQMTPLTPVNRVMVIHSDTSYVNVTHGDVIEFIVDNKPFVWDFDGARALDEIDLAKIAPAGMINHPVRIYIARNKHTDYGA